MTTIPVPSGQSDDIDSDAVLRGLLMTWRRLENSMQSHDVRHSDLCVDVQAVVLDLMEKTAVTTVEGVFFKLLAWRLETFGDDISDATRSERVALSALDDLARMTNLSDSVDAALDAASAERLASETRSHRN